MRTREAAGLARLVRALLILGVALMLVACGGRASNGGKGSETNWLSQCSQDSECNQGSCLCGVCTIACSSVSQCGEIDEDAACVSLGSLGCGSDVISSVCAEDIEQLEDALEGASNREEAGTGRSDSDAGFDPDDADDDAAAGDEEDDQPTSSSDDEGEDTSSDAPVMSDDGDQVGELPEVAVEAPDAQEPATKVDLLLVVDNSLSMADKQVLLAQALPDLVDRLVSPACVDAASNVVARLDDASDQCPAGSEREFSPLTDLHVGIITTSLGGYGAVRECTESDAEHSEQRVDMARLLASLPRGANAVGSADDGFLSWRPGDSRDAFVSDFSSLVQASGEFGCGWEASLESWLRFLVEPYPYTRIVRQPCSAGDANSLCSGPETDASGDRLIDGVILTQRESFLRPDSLVSIVMLSDENDCSFRASGQSWRLSQATDESGVYTPAYRGSAACSDPEFGPDDACCVSCGTVSAVEGCPTELNAHGNSVALGCSTRQYSADAREDHPNLRCFEQKRRFGVDFLYPTERYSNALSLARICPSTDTLAPNENGNCVDGTSPVDNPLFVRYDANGDRLPVRPKQHVLLSGLVGVPWQDLALDASPDVPLVYRSSTEVDWDLVLGPANPPGDFPAPGDPLMRESVEPRSGTHPITGEAIAGLTAGVMANSINGHEYESENSDLQYACISRLPQPRECISQDEADQRINAGEVLPACECTTWSSSDNFAYNPLCQGDDGNYGLDQHYLKAYPALRQLEVMRELSDTSVVGSICMKESLDPNVADYGYRPFVSALVKRMRGALAP